MTEIFLVLSNLLFGISILTYFFLKELRNEQPDKDRLISFSLENMDSLTETAAAYISSLEKISKSKDDLFQKTLLEYLKHNERLERMILPQPVTRKAVQDILDQTPPLVPNDIEKIPEEIEQDNLNELLNKIPITKNTKVKFEDDMELPEEIETEPVPDAMSGKLS